MTRALVWFRRDLRVHDLPALAAARAADEVGFVFVVEPSMLAAAPRRAAFCARAVDSLATELRRRDAHLTIVAGPAHEAIPDLARALGADTVHATADVTPRAQTRDAAVAKHLGSATLVLHPGLAVHQPGAIAKDDGEPYKVFSPYHRRWRSTPLRSPAPTPRRLANTIEGRRDEEAEGMLRRARELTIPDRFASDERAALATVRRFIRSSRSHRGPDPLDGSGSSGLSPALRFGLLSPVRAAMLAQDDDDWLRQLAWRDFCLDTTAAWPKILTRSLRDEPRWQRDARLAHAWRTGETGEDVVDAAMRQLAEEGWISNRARMTVGSWLVRDNDIDWRIGARHFMRTLIDGDPAVNAFNWQWVAGTGFSTPAPFWRLSPPAQGRRYDPDRRWRKRWT